MFELPEYVNLARQMHHALTGRTIRRGCLGNAPGKFVWYNRSHAEFEALTEGKVVGKATTRGRWLFLALEPGFVLVFGECGGRILYHQANEPVPKKYHLFVTFEDGSYLTAMTQMWGAMELYKAGDVQNRQYVKDMRPTPVDPEFTFDYFSGLMDDALAVRKHSAKALLTQYQLIPGLGNAIAQDILFHARLHPKHDVADLDSGGRRALYDAIKSTVDTVIESGGRYDEVDLYGDAGRYIRIMDKNAVGRPCQACGDNVIRLQYLGGSCYLCPSCQT